MATFTTRLGLTKPATTENYDVGVWNGNSDLVDAATANVTVCTSATRPSTPDEGDLIYETDSTNLLIRQGAAWKSFNAKVHICTSGTRPSSTLTYGGFVIYETDTGNRQIRNAANSAWIPQSPYRVADATARNALTGIDGLIIYRQDRDWVEVYDGTAWRVQGTAACSSTSDRDSAITSPYNGLLAYTTDSGTVWKRQAGSWVASSSVGVGAVIVATKTADETVNNSATLQDDDHLSVSVQADAVYLVELEGVYNSGATPGFKTQLAAPAGSTAGSAIGAGGTGSGFGGVTLTTALNWGGAGAERWFRFTGKLTTAGTAGSLKLQWAQTAANASNTILDAGSSLRITRTA